MKLYNKNLCTLDFLNLTLHITLSKLNFLFFFAFVFCYLFSSRNLHFLKDQILWRQVSKRVLPTTLAVENQQSNQIPDYIVSMSVTNTSWVQIFWYVCYFLHFLSAEVENFCYLTSVKDVNRLNNFIMLCLLPYVVGDVKKFTATFIKKRIHK